MEKEETTRDKFFRLYPKAHNLYGFFDFLSQSKFPEFVDHLRVALNFVEEEPELNKHELINRFETILTVRAVNVPSKSRDDYSALTQYFLHLMRAATTVEEKESDESSFMAISTPSLDAIFQKQGFDDNVQQWMYTAMGFLLRNDERKQDQWQTMPLKPCGTGYNR